MPAALGETFRPESDVAGSHVNADKSDRRVKEIKRMQSVRQSDQEKEVRIPDFGCHHFIHFIPRPGAVSGGSPLQDSLHCIRLPTMFVVYLFTGVESSQELAEGEGFARYVAAQSSESGLLWTSACVCSI